MVKFIRNVFNRLMGEKYGSSGADSVGGIQGLNSLRNINTYKNIIYVRTLSFEQ